MATAFRGQDGPKWEQALRRVNNPNGVFSGMTAGIAAQDGEHVTVTNMPGDSRNIGSLPDQNPHYD